jgi:hypothetical protein
VTLQTDKLFGVDDPCNRATDFHFHRGGHEGADGASVGGKDVDELLTRLAGLADKSQDGLDFFGTTTNQQCVVAFA